MNILAWAYRVFVRPILEHCTLMWNPYLKKYIISTEKVRNYLTKSICYRLGLRSLDASLVLNLESLELRGDPVMVYSLIYGLTD